MLRMHKINLTWELSKVRTRIALIAVALVVTCTGISAKQDTPAPKPQPVANDSKRDEVTGGADVTRGPWGGEGAVVMKGHVWFQHGDTRLTSDHINYDQAVKVKTATSPGKLTISDPECDISGNKGTAYFIKRLGVIEGNVVMLLKPKPDPNALADKDSVRSKLRQPTTITCSKIEYLYKKKLATAFGGVIFQQEKRKATADKAVYDHKSELLTLTGNVEAVDEEGQTFSAPKAVISLKKGDEWIDVPNAKATFKIDLGDEEEKPD